MPDSDLKQVGYDPSVEHAGNFVVEDWSIIESIPRSASLEVLPLANAMERYPWLRERYFHLIDREQDEYTKEAAAIGPTGFFGQEEPFAVQLVQVD